MYDDRSMEDVDRERWELELNQKINFNVKVTFENSEQRVFTSLGITNTFFFLTRRKFRCKTSFSTIYVNLFKNFQRKSDPDGL